MRGIRKLPWGIQTDRKLILRSTSFGTVDFVGYVVVGKDSYIGNYSVVGFPRRNNISHGPTTKAMIGDGALLRYFTTIYEDVTIGNNFESGAYAQIREGNRIGSQVSIGTHTIIERDSTIGDRVRIHSNNFVPENTVVESDVWIGPCVTMLNDKYPVTDVSYCDGPRICRGAVIGADSTILPGVVIGRGAIVAAKSLVARDVPSKSVVMGSPARTCMTREEYEEKREHWIRRSRGRNRRL